MPYPIRRTDTQGKAGRSKAGGTSKSKKKRKRTLVDESEEEEEEKDTLTYRTKSNYEALIIAQSCKNGLAAKKSNGGRMPRGWYNDELARLHADDQCKLLKLTFKKHDIENKIRAIEGQETTSATTSTSSSSDTGTALTATASAAPPPLQLLSPFVWLQLVHFYLWLVHHQPLLCPPWQPLAVACPTFHLPFDCCVIPIPI